MLRLLFAAMLQTRHIYSELNTSFYKEHLNTKWKEFLRAKVELWADTHASIDHIYSLLKQ